MRLGAFWWLCLSEAKAGTRFDFVEEITGIRGGKPARRTAEGASYVADFSGRTLWPGFRRLRYGADDSLDLSGQASGHARCFYRALRSWIRNLQYPTALAGLVVGLLLGILLSLPDAIITKATVPILASGAFGGLIIGWIAGKFGH